MVTRLYLDASIPAEVNPAFDAAWAAVGSALRRLMSPGMRTGDALADGSAISSTSGQNALHRQYVSPPMAADNVFRPDAPITRFSLQVQGLESAINDNITNRMRYVAICSRDGTTIQRVLMAVSAFGTVTEWATSMWNLTFIQLNAQTGASYTSVAGDRIVVELGHNAPSGTSISGTTRYGSDPAGTGDLGVNETDTATTLRPWFEVNTDIIWERSQKGVFVPQAVQRSAVW